jgi:hypothetical protein
MVQEDLKTMKSTDHVFISYSQYDKSFVDQLVERLRSSNINCWYDTGLNTDKINDSLKKKMLLDAATLLYVSSKNSVRSESMDNELKEFLNQQKRRVIPIIIDSDGAINIPKELSKVGAIDFRENYNQALKSLIDILSEQPDHQQRFLLLDWINKGINTIIDATSQFFTWIGTSIKRQKKESEPILLASLEYVITISDNLEDGISNLEEYIWEHEEQWRNEIIQAINKELQIKYGQDVYAKIRETRRGSIVVGIDVLQIYDFISKLKDFSEGILLIAVIANATREFVSKGGNITTLTGIKVEQKLPEGKPDIGTKPKKTSRNSYASTKNYLIVTIVILVLVLVGILFTITWRLLDILDTSISTPKNTHIDNSVHTNNSITNNSGSQFSLTPTIQALDAQGLEFSYSNTNVDGNGGVILRTVINTLSNGNRKPITALSPDNFSIQETYQNKKMNARVLKVTPLSIPLAIIILLDTSGSMAYDTKNGNTSKKFEHAKKAVLLFVEDMMSINDPSSRISILPFSDKFSFLKKDDGTDYWLLQPENFLNSKEKIEAIPTPKRDDNTRLYGAILYALKYQDVDNNRYKLIICLSDGFNTVNDAKRQELFDEFDNNPVHIPVITAGFGADKEYDPDALEKIAIRSHAGTGSYINLAPEDLANILKQLSTEIKTIYEVQWKSSFSNPGNKVDYTILAQFPSVSGDILFSTLSDSYTIPIK